MATWLEDVHKALINIGGIGNLSSIYSEVERIRISPLSKTWTASVRRVLEHHSSDSKAFTGTKDLFYSVGGIGKGIWGLRDLAEQKSITAEDLPDPPNTNPARASITTSRIIRDSNLARKLKLLYHDHCQICAIQLPLSGGSSYSEGHHLMPLGKPHNGPDSKDNLMIVCPNCHAQLDFGAIRIDKLKIEKHELGDEYIRYHNTIIYRDQS